MTKIRLCGISALLLIGSVPWFFTEFRSSNLFGFPSWAFYSLCITLLYAIITAIFFQRYWSLFAGNDELKAISHKDAKITKEIRFKYKK